MTRNQEKQALPDPEEFAAQISASLQFIDQNSAAVVCDLSPEMLDIWRLSPHELDLLKECLDYIIIDESSQVDVITAALAFSACRNVVIVGDEQQLPHIVTDAVREKANELRERFDVPPEYDYVAKNIITSLTALYGDSVPKTLLREHHRCNPMIVGFCNRKYYQGRLIVMKDEPMGEYDAANYSIRIFRTVEGNHGHNKTNERQMAVIEHEILPQCADVSPDEIGIITPYRNQANLLQKTGIESDTIHKFQGREKRKIIFSTVSNEIVSCFDMLQPDHSKSLDDFKKRIKGTSRFESENIIETAIRSIIDETPAYSGFYLRRGYPLYLLTSKKQERDAIKDKVLALNGIELLRLNTKGCQEEDRIREKLRTITSSLPT